MGILYILLGIAIGAIITYQRMQNNPIADKEELDKLKQWDQSLNKRITSVEEKYQQLEDDLNFTKEALANKEIDLPKLETEFTEEKEKPEAEVQQQLPATEVALVTAEVPTVSSSAQQEELNRQVSELSQEKSKLENKKRNLEEENIRLYKKLEILEKKLQENSTKFEELERSHADELKAHEASKIEIKEQKEAIQALGKRFNSDFQKIGVKILEELASKKKV
ncbi:MAG: hypothetical protein NXI20_05615 [bacterium]|nr:hypothetical protein [bacterium]